MGNKRFNQIVEKFICCVGNKVIGQIAVLASMQPVANPHYKQWQNALATWAPYSNFICGVSYYIRLIIKSNNCMKTTIFDSDANDTNILNWKYHCYKLKNVCLSYPMNMNMSYPYTSCNNCNNCNKCCKSQSVIVYIGLRVDACGNPIPGSYTPSQ